MLKPVGGYVKKEIQTLETYWQNKTVDDDDRDITKSAVHTRRLMPSFDSFVYAMQDDTALKIGTGKLSVKEITIRTISYGLVCLDHHPKLGPVTQEIYQLHHDIVLNSDRKKNKRRWLNEQVQLEDHPFECFTLFVGQAARGYIDDNSRKLGMTKYSVAALLWYLALENYKFEDHNPNTGYLDQEVTDNLAELEDILVDRLVKLRAFKGEFFVELCDSGDKLVD